MNRRVRHATVHAAMCAALGLVVLVLPALLRMPAILLLAPALTIAALGPTLERWFTRQHETPMCPREQSALETVLHGHEASRELAWVRTQLTPGALLRGLAAMLVVVAALMPNPFMSVVAAIALILALALSVDLMRRLQRWMAQADAIAGAAA